MRAAVQHHHVAAGRQPGFKLRRIDAFGAVVVLHPLAERLGRHVDSAEQHVAGGFPGARAAVQHGHIGGAIGFEPFGQPLREAAPVVDADDARRLARQQGAGADLALG